jgi:hypothetical protein
MALGVHSGEVGDYRTEKSRTLFGEIFPWSLNWQKTKY